MAAFAGNSLLCRAALRGALLDPARFTALRLVSGALILALLARGRQGARPGRGSWGSALALFAYAAAFSFAYLSLPAGTGALLLFCAVQATMIGHGVWTGERLGRRQVTGLVLAFAGLAVLLRPGLAAPAPGGAALMLGAGTAWGIYSLRGRSAGDPTQVTAGNFLRATPFALLLAGLLPGTGPLDPLGVACAVASGAVASGLGYALWYAVLPHLGATQAASVQLSVPALTALGGVLLLGEPLSGRLAGATLAILGGIALVLRAPALPPALPPPPALEPGPS